MRTLPPSLKTNLRVDFGALWIKLTEWNHALQERLCTSEFADVNDAFNRWYLPAVLQNIYPVGPQLCEKVKEIVKPNEWTDGRRDTMWKEWESAENQETWEGRLSIRGRRGYLSFYRNIRVRKSGTSMKLLVLGGFYLIMASAREDHSVKVAKRQNSDSCLNCKKAKQS